MLPIVRHVLLTARRDRFLVALAVLFLLGVAAGATLGAGSLVEHADTALVLASAGLRPLVALGMIVFVAFHVRRSVETREMELLLSRPVSRGRVILGLYAGFAAVALVLVAATVLLVSPLAAPAGLAQWGLSLAVEALAVTAIALACALGLSSAVGAVLGAAAFYVLARLAGTLLGLAEKALAGGEGVGPFEVLAAGLRVLGVLVPRLDLQGQSVWLLRGPDPAAWIALAQVLLIVPLMLALATIDLRRQAGRSR